MADLQAVVAVEIDSTGAVKGSATTVDAINKIRDSEEELKKTTEAATQAVNKNQQDIRTEVTETAKSFEQLQNEAVKTFSELRRSANSSDLNILKEIGINSESAVKSLRELGKTAKKELTDVGAGLKSTSTGFNTFDSAVDGFVKSILKSFSDAKKAVINFGRSTEKSLNDTINKAVDPTSASFNKLKGTFSDFAETVERRSPAIGAALKAALKPSTVALVSFGTASVTSTRNFIPFQQGLANLQAITGVTNDDLQILSDTAKELSLTSGIAANDIVNAFQAVAAIRGDLGESTGALTEVTEAVTLLARASGEDLELAARTVGNTLSQFRLESTDAARVVDILAAGSKVGAAEVGDLSLALNNVGASAGALGVSLETTVAGVETLARSGINGARAGFQLRNVLLNLEKSADENLKPSIVGLSAALETLKEQQLSTTELIKIFGVENVNASQVLLDNVDTLKLFEQQVGEVGVALEQATIREDTLRGQLNQASVSFDTLTKSFAEFLNLPDIGSFGLDLLNDILLITNNRLIELEKRKDFLINFGPDLFRLAGILDDTNDKLKESEEDVSAISKIFSATLTVLEKGTKNVGLDAFIKGFESLKKSMEDVNVSALDLVNNIDNVIIPFRRAESIIPFRRAEEEITEASEGTEKLDDTTKNFFDTLKNGIQLLEEEKKLVGASVEVLARRKFIQDALKKAAEDEIVLSEQQKTVINELGDAYGKAAKELANLQATNKREEQISAEIKSAQRLLKTEQQLLKANKEQAAVIKVEQRLIQRGFTLQDKGITQLKELLVELELLKIKTKEAADETKDLGEALIKATNVGFNLGEAIGSGDLEGLSNMFTETIGDSLTEAFTKDETFKAFGKSIESAFPDIAANLGGAQGISAGIGAGVAGVGSALAQEFTDSVGGQIGSTLGGAIGLAVGGPVGSAIGSLLGGLVGSLFGGGPSAPLVSTITGGRGQLTEFRQFGGVGQKTAGRGATSAFGDIGVGGFVSQGFTDEALQSLKQTAETFAEVDNVIAQSLSPEQITRVISGLEDIPLTVKENFDDITDVLKGRVTDIFQIVGGTAEDVFNQVINALPDADIGQVVGVYASLNETIEKTGLSAKSVTDLFNKLTEDANNLENELTGITNLINVWAGATGEFSVVLNNLIDDIAAVQSLGEVGEGVSDTILRVAGNFALLKDGLEGLSNTTFDLSTASVIAVDNLVQLAGSAELLAGRTQFFFDNFLSDQERLDRQAKITRKAVDQFNKEFDLIGKNSIQTKDDLKELALQQDLTTESGRSLFDAILRLAPSLQALEDATNALGDATDSLGDTADDTAQRLRDFINSLLLDSALSPLTNQQRLLEAQRQFEDVSRRALAGDTDAVDELQSVSRDLLETSREFFASSPEFTRIFNQVRGILETVSTNIEQDESLALTEGINETLNLVELIRVQQERRNSEQREEAKNLSEQIERLTEQQIQISRQQIDLQQQQLESSIQTAVFTQDVVTNTSEPSQVREIV